VKSLKTTKNVAGKKLVNPTDKQVGSQVRVRRLALRMSQTTLAVAVGLTFQQIQKYEKGTNRISASRLQQFSNILNKPISFFFEGAPGVPAPSKAKSAGLSITDVSEFISSSVGLTVMKAFVQIKDAKLRRSIVDFVEQLAVKHGQ
jgi:transcriptional regulator with XRE-family HTH domain